LVVQRKCRRATIQPPPDPDQLDIEDAIAASSDEPAPASSPVEDDPIKRYNEEQKRTAPQRQLWGDALRALEEIARQPSPEELLANRYDRFDYLFWPALENAVAWATRLLELRPADDDAADSVASGKER
jgi:hypothetical protein